MTKPLAILIMGNAFAAAAAAFSGQSVYCGIFTFCAICMLIQFAQTKDDSK